MFKIAIKIIGHVTIFWNAIVLSNVIDFFRFTGNCILFGIYILQSILPQKICSQHRQKYKGCFLSRFQITKFPNGYDSLISTKGMSLIAYWFLRYKHLKNGQDTPTGKSSILRISPSLSLLELAVCSLTKKVIHLHWTKYLYLGF